MKGIVITTDNELEIKDFGEPLHKTLGEAVGGYIEVVRLAGPYRMIVDEEGLLKDYEVNPMASYLYNGNYIVGNAVIMKEGYVDGEPDIVGLNDVESEGFMRDLKAIQKFVKKLI